VFIFVNFSFALFTPL
jgi:hypothetical protein